MKKMFRYNKLYLIIFGLLVLASTVNVSNHAKYTSLNNQQCMSQATLINLNPNLYS